MVLLAWAGSAWGWGYPPYGGYGASPGAGYPYQGQPQGAYPGVPQGPYQAAPYAYPFQYRPAQPDNARGVPPAYPAPPVQGSGQSETQTPGQSGSQTPSGGQPPSYQPGYPGGYQGAYPGGYPAGYPGGGHQGGWPGGYNQPQAQRQLQPPRLEWSIDETQPYVQQNVLLRLTLTSDESLTTADPDLSASGDVLLEKLAGPTSTTRSAGEGRRQVVTEFVLTLTPTRTGNLELPPIKITGTRPGAYGGSERYEAVAADPIRLQVRPAMASVRPWLPVKSLTLNATVDRPEEVRPGQPVTLALELSAVGADAAQLPSLQDQLVSRDFRVYREQTLTDSGLSKDARQLVGKRTEYFTLVPQSGGTLRLPEIAVPWWNVDTGTRQVASLPIRTLNIAGGSGPFSLPDSVMEGGSGWGKVWLPFAAILLVLAGYWAGVFYRRGEAGEGPGLAQRLRTGLGGGAKVAGAQARAALRRLHPAPLATRAHSAALDLLPQSSRFLMVVRYANQAKDAAGWCERFEQAARRHLRVPGKATTSTMTERMLALRPRADRAKLTRLMEQLDAALYGRQDIDFPRWKRDFMRQVGRASGLLRPARRDSRIRRAHLPELNPRAA